MVAYGSFWSNFSASPRLESLRSMANWLNCVLQIIEGRFGLGLRQRRNIGIQFAEGQGLAIDRRDDSLGRWFFGGGRSGGLTTERSTGIMR